MGQMRSKIDDNFDASATLSKVRSEKSRKFSLANIDFDPGTVDVKEYDKERKIRDERRKELAKPKLKELKKETLRWFDEWQSGFLRRVNEAVTPDKKPIQQLDRPLELSDTPKAESNHSFPPKLEQLYPRFRTSLTKLPIQTRETVLHSFLLLLLSLQNYNATSRVFLLYLTSSLKLGPKSLRDCEEKTASGLLQAAKQISASKEAINKSRESDESRRWKMRLATIAGAAVVGLSGGYAAPLIAASFGTVMSELGLGASAAAGYLGSVAGNTYLVGSLFGAYGGRMTSEMMRNLSADVQDFAFLPVHGMRTEHTDSIEAATDSRRLRVTIAISGWLLEKEEIVSPWRVLGPATEVFALRFELKTLMELGQSINTMTSNSAYGYAQSVFATRAAYTELSSAIWPIALVKIARVVENPFSLAKSRAEKAGRILAETLINRAQGERPVALVGYSLGARVIWSCLTTLAERRAFGLVESAVLIGSPSPSDITVWRSMRTVVSGRLINVYSTNDYLLAFLHRASSLQYGVAGLSPIEGLMGVENFDFSELVSGHLRYRYLVGAILQKIGFDGLDRPEIIKESEAFKTMVEEEKKYDYVQDAKDSAGDLYKRYGERTKLSPNEKPSNTSADKEASAMENEIRKKTQKGLMQWAAEQLYISPSSDISTKGIQSSKEVTQPDAVSSRPKGTIDTSGKTVYQRAKEAVYLQRSGGPNGDQVKTNKDAAARSEISTTSYLATAAGYIPTGYLPTFKTAGTDQKAGANTKEKQATVKTPTSNRKMSTEPESKAVSEKKKPQDMGSRTGSGAVERPSAIRDLAKPNDSAVGSPKKINDVKDTTTNSEVKRHSVHQKKTKSHTGGEAPKSDTDAKEKAAGGGLKSYLPSFGFGSSAATVPESHIPDHTVSQERSGKEVVDTVKNEAGAKASELTKDPSRVEEDIDSSKEGVSSIGSNHPSSGSSGSSASKAKRFIREDDDKMSDSGRKPQDKGLEDPFLG